MGGRGGMGRLPMSALLGEGEFVKEYSAHETEMIVSKDESE